MPDAPVQKDQLLQALLDAGFDVKSLPPSVRGDLKADIAQWDRWLETFDLSGIEKVEREKWAEKIAKNKLKQKLLKDVQAVPPIQTAEAEALVAYGELKDSDKKKLTDKLDAKLEIAVKDLASRYAALGIGDDDDARLKMAVAVARTEGDAEKKRLEHALSPPKVAEAKNEVRKRLVEVRALLEHFRSEGTPGPMLTAGKDLLERILLKFDAEPSGSDGRCTVALEKGAGHGGEKRGDDVYWSVSNFQILADDWVNPFVEISLPKDAEYHESLRRALEECALGAQAVSAAAGSEQEMVKMIERWAADTETPILPSAIPPHVVHILGLNRAVWIFATLLERCALEQRRIEETAAWVGTNIDGAEAKPVESDKPLKELQARLEAEGGVLLAWREENRQTKLKELKERLAVDRMKLLELAGGSGEKGIAVYKLKDEIARQLKPVEPAAARQNISSKLVEKEEIEIPFLADELKAFDMEDSGIPEQSGPELTRDLVPVPENVRVMIRIPGSDQLNQSFPDTRQETGSREKSPGGFWSALIAEKDALFGKAAQPVDNLGEGVYKVPEDPVLKGAFPRLGGLLKEAATAPMKLLGPLLAIFAPLMILGIPNPLKALFKSNDLELSPDVLWMYVLVTGILGASWIAFWAAWSIRGKKWLVLPPIVISVFLAVLWFGRWVPAGMDKYAAPARVEALQNTGFQAVAYYPDLPVYACMEWRRQYPLLQVPSPATVPATPATPPATPPPVPSFTFGAPPNLDNTGRSFTNESAVKDLLKAQPTSFGDIQAQNQLKTDVGKRIEELRETTIPALQAKISLAPAERVPKLNGELSTLQGELANLERWQSNFERFKRFYQDLLVLTADSKPLDEAAVKAICDSAWRNGFHPMREAAAFVLAEKLRSAGIWMDRNLSPEEKQISDNEKLIVDHRALMTRLVAVSIAPKAALETGKAASPAPAPAALETLVTSYETADQVDGGTRLFLEKAMLDHANELKKRFDGAWKGKTKADPMRNELKDLIDALTKGAQASPTLNAPATQDEPTLISRQVTQDARTIWPAIQAESSRRLLRNLKTALTVTAVTSNLGNNTATFTTAFSADDLDILDYLARVLTQAAALNGNAGNDAFQVYLRAIKTLAEVESGADAAGRIVASQESGAALFGGIRTPSTASPSPSVANTAELTQSNLAKSPLWTNRSWHYWASCIVCLILVGCFAAGAATTGNDLEISRRLLRLALCVLAVWVLMMLECRLSLMLMAAGFVMLWQLSGTFKWIGAATVIFGLAIWGTGAHWQGLVPAYEDAATASDKEHVKRRVINFLRGDQTVWNDNTPWFDASPLALLLAPSDRALDAKQKGEALEREPHVAETGLRSVRPWGAVATCTALVAALMWFGWLAYRDLRNKHEIALGAARRQAEQKVLANAERLLDDSAKKETAQDKNLLYAWIERFVRSLRMRLEDKDTAAQDTFEQQKAKAEARANLFKARLKLLDGLDKEAEKLRAVSLKLRDATFQAI